MYRCVIIGASGGRAKGHAEAYRHIGRGELVAVSSRNREKLSEFAARYGIGRTYTDYREMFRKEKPDLVHVNTPPDVRLEVLRAAEEEGVRSLIVEKPLVVQGEDYREIARFAEESKVKVAINHQLQFHPRRRFLQNLVLSGRIGELRCVEASSGMNLAYQGTHSLQAIGAFMPEATPLSVFAQLSGAKGLAENPSRHYAPDESLASVKYDNGIDAILRCGDNAPRMSERPINHHKRIAVYGAKGYVYWTMWGWETFIGGVTENGSHDYGEEDVRGQAAMTEAMFDWLENEQAVHPLELRRALSDVNIILGMYMSALHSRVIGLPVEPEDDLVAKLRTYLSREEKT